jgi:hypothetical protein
MLYLLVPRNNYCFAAALPPSVCMYRRRFLQSARTKLLLHNLKIAEKVGRYMGIVVEPKEVE